MERDETIARLVAITQEPLQMIGRELKAMAGELQSVEQAARRAAQEATTVPAMHKALTDAAEAKGSRLMAEQIAAAIFGSIAKGA